MSAIEPLPRDEELSVEEMIAFWIRGEIARRGVQQTDVARRLGLSQAAISQKLSGRRGISFTEFFDFAALFGLTPEEMMKRARRDSNPQPSDPSVDELSARRRFRPTRPVSPTPGEVVAIDRANTR